ncbi:MAG: hypothetical protein ACTSPD_21155 [Promethearchaeota archaeon]
MKGRLIYFLLVQNESNDWNGILLFQSDDLSRHHIFPGGKFIRKPRIR